MPVYFRDVTLTVLRCHQVGPGHEIEPGSSLVKAVINIRNGPVFGHGNQLLTARKILELIEGIFLIPVVKVARVGIVPDNVHLIVPWIPGLLGSGPDPDQLM